MPANLTSQGWAQLDEAGETLLVVMAVADVYGKKDICGVDKQCEEGVV
jgi:hypothetical protein